MHHLRQGLFGKVKFVVYLPDVKDRPNLSDVYLNVYDLVENDFFNNLAQAFSISGLEKIEKDFFKSLGQDFLTIGQDIIDSQYEEIKDEITNQIELNVKTENMSETRESSLLADPVEEGENKFDDDFAIGPCQFNDNIEDLDMCLVEDRDYEPEKKKVKSTNSKTHEVKKFSIAHNEILEEAEKVAKVYPCPVCPAFISTTKKKRDEHMVSLHREYKKYKCTDCDYKSNFQMNVKWHIDIKVC